MTCSSLLALSSAILDKPTKAAQNPGPIGAPTTTTQEGIPFLPTPFQYTTTIGGVKTAIQDTFTPPLGFPSTVLTKIPATGSILGYSEWLAQYRSTATNSASSPIRWLTERTRGMV
ncbi:hypothetical protein VNI00_017901 [Paramarasmius palmivorus]|uniref:Uncharacterized protein n=1 Tax=Paramarasmius palmivorus TaxID=297713 RepID=A0AAW0B573_9AGAR